jgi:hypothetical protein
VSLRKALAALPDDRTTRSALHGVVSYLDTHRDVPFELSGITRGTGLDDVRVESVLRALAAAFVIDCDGDPRSTSCTYKPDSVLSLEVRQFLRNSGGGDARLQRGVDRFRGRQSPGT